MNLIIWNCNQGLHRKAEMLLKLAPDIAVVSEAARQARTLTSKARSHLWVGAEKDKGLGIYSFGDHVLELHASYDKRIQWVAPITVSGPRKFLLLAVWAMNNQAIEKHPEHKDVGSVQAALEVYQPLIESCGLPLVVAGDFNSNLHWDKREKNAVHHNTLRALVQAGLVSAYHRARNVGQGQEPDPTYWRDRKASGQRYHIDYCFVPEAWATDKLQVTVGQFAPWVSEHWSDHAPMSVSLP